MDFHSQWELRGGDHYGDGLWGLGGGGNTVFGYGDTLDTDKRRNIINKNHKIHNAGRR